MATNFNGSNLATLRGHFTVTEDISSADVDQIVSDAASIFAHCIRSGTRGLSKGLIYGNIQSGKTAVILALVAIAADNGYSRFIVLTSDLNDLYEQTLNRFKNSLHGISVLGKTDLRTPANAHVPRAVLVASKNVHVLRRSSAIASNAGWLSDTVLLIDDEADQASLNTAINLPLNGPSGVNREITALRRACA